MSGARELELYFVIVKRSQQSKGVAGKVNVKEYKRELEIIYSVLSSKAMVSSLDASVYSRLMGAACAPMEAGEIGSLPSVACVDA